MVTTLVNTSGVLAGFLVALVFLLVLSALLFHQGRKLLLTFSSNKRSCTISNNDLNPFWNIRSSSSRDSSRRVCSTPSKEAGENCSYLRVSPWRICKNTMTLKHRNPFPPWIAVHHQTNFLSVVFRSIHTQGPVWLR